MSYYRLFLLGAIKHKNNLAQTIIQKSLKLQCENQNDVMCD